MDENPRTRPVYSARRGHGCLGSYEGTSVFWYRNSSTGEVTRIEHRTIFTYEDTWTGYVWVMFDTNEGLDSYVLDPKPDVVPRAVHPKLREFLEDGT